LNRQRNIEFVEVTLAVFSWGVSFVATKIALREVAPITIIWLRFGIGLVILGIAAVVRRQMAWPARQDLAYLALVGFIGITFHQWLQSTGLRTTQATTTAWIVATIPIFMAILGWLWLKERLTWWQALGIGMAAIGVLMVVTRGDLGSLSRGQIGTFGNMLVLISAPNWAVFSVLSRRGLRTYPATRMILYVMGFGWLFTSVLFFAGPGLPELFLLSGSGWLAIAFLGVFCSGLAYIFWYDALQNLPVAQAGAFVYIEPFITVIVAAILLDEALYWISLMGGGLILAGVILVQQATRMKKRLPD
jgi:drug/metabolite transporter (DMT)-like permease